jgi:hypothetical protein
MSYIMKKYPFGATIVMLFITLYVISLEWPSHTRRGGMSGAQLVPLYLRMEFGGCNVHLNLCLGLEGNFLLTLFLWFLMGELQVCLLMVEGLN